MLKISIAIACVFSACAKAPPYVKATDVVMKKYCKSVSDVNHIKILGCGGFFESGYIRGFYADFESGKSISKEEAKDLLTGLVQTCLMDLNHEAGLAKYLMKTPIIEENVSISIGFVGDDRMPHQGLAQIHLFENKIYYSSYDTSQKTYVVTQTEPLSLDNHTAHLPYENSMDTGEDLNLPIEIE